LAVIWRYSPHPGEAISALDVIKMFLRPRGHRARYTCEAGLIFTGPARIDEDVTHQICRPSVKPGTHNLMFGVQQPGDGKMAVCGGFVSMSIEAMEMYLYG